VTQSASVGAREGAGGVHGGAGSGAGAVAGVNIGMEGNQFAWSEERLRAGIRCGYMIRRSDPFNLITIWSPE
jgi:hypothetical protein